MAGLIHLFRHGAALAPPGTMVGSSDVELSPKGRGQAEAWRDRLDMDFSLAVTSPLQRARRTADLILSGQPNRPVVRVMPELREIFLGEWEGRSKDWVQARYPVEWAARGRDLWSVRPPGGESFHDLQARVWPAFQALGREAAAEAHSLVVAHQAVIRVILAALPSREPRNIFEWPLPPAVQLVLAAHSGGGLEFVGQYILDV